MESCAQYAVWIKRLATLLLVFLLCACTGTALYSGLSEQQANEVVAELLNAQIDADKARSSGNEPVWTVMVSKTQFDDAMRVLRAAGLPREAKQSLGDIFKKEGFVSSALEEKARYIHGLERSFESTIMGIDGVVSASVHIALAERDLLSNELQPARASVTIIQEPNSKIEQQKVNIISLVRNGVEGLENPDDITVLFFDAHPRPTVRTNANASLWSPRNLLVGGLILFSAISLIAALKFFSNSRRTA